MAYGMNDAFLDEFDEWRASHGIKGGDSLDANPSPLMCAIAMSACRIYDSLYRSAMDIQAADHTLAAAKDSYNHSRMVAEALMKEFPPPAADDISG